MNGLARAYYPLPLAAKKLNCSVEDILHLGATNRLEICAYVQGVEEKEDYCTFNVFFEEEYEEDIVREIRENNSVITDMYEVALFNKLDSMVLKENELKFRSWYANHLKGFFALPSEYLIDIELSILDDWSYLSPRELYTPNNYGRRLHLANIDCLSIPENRLVVFNSELLGFDSSTTPKYPGSGNETPKTAAKKSQIILSLIKLIPDMKDVDLEKTPITKIISLIEAIAAKNGVELPETHRQTWQKYLGR